MTFAIHISSRIKNDLFLNCFLKYADQNKDDHFILISDGTFIIPKILPQNCTPVSLDPLIKNQLLRYYWYNYKLPSILNRYNADIYFSPVFAASLKSKVPAVIFLYENTGTPEVAINSTTLKYLRFAKLICSTNPVQLQNISFKYPFLAKKLMDIPVTIKKDFKPADYDLQLKINERIANGNDHFTALITKHNKESIITLLKAFSIFKKWQHSSFELIIINKTGIDKILPELESYKHRTAVHLIPYYAKFEHEIISSSFAYIDLPDLITGKMQALKAMNCAIPVISTNSSKNIFGDGVIYAEITDKSLAEKMMLIYKDEILRTQTIKKGNEFAEENSDSKMLAAIKNIAEKALNQTS